MASSERQRRSTARERARAEQAKAQAELARSAAEQASAAAAAEKAKSEAESIRAKAELERIQAAAKQRSDDAAERQREFVRQQTAAAEKEAQEAREGLRKAGINAAALGVGVAGGLVYAKKIDAHRTAAVTAAAPKLAEMAKDARTVIKQYETGKNVPAAAKKLRGIVNAADKAKFTAKAPIGIGPAAVLLAEGAISRFIIAPQFEDPTTREAFQAIGTTSAVAATTIIGKGTVNVSTPAAPVNGRDLAAIESARTIADAESKAVRARTPTPRNVAKAAAAKAKPTLRIAGGAAAIAVAGPAVAALTAFDATKSAAMAEGVSEGRATAEATGTAALVGGGVAAVGYAVGRGMAAAARKVAQTSPILGKVASRALLPATLTYAAATEGRKGYAAGGIVSAAVETSKATVDILSGGLIPLLNQNARAILLPNGGQSPQPAASRAGRAYISADASLQVSERRRQAAQPTRSSNGWVEGYVRSDGTRVQGYRRVD